MINEYADFDHNVLVVDGFLPSQKSLKNILNSRNENSAYAKHPSDTNLLDDFALRLSRIYEQSSLGKEKSNAYIHMLKPESLSSKLEIHNPIRYEFASLNKNKNNYRLFILIPTKEGSSESFNTSFPNLYSGFIETLDLLKFSQKPENTYSHIASFINYCSSLADFFLHRYFLPFDSIRDHLSSVGFKSEDSMI